MQLVPPFRARESVTDPASQLMQAVVELDEYCPASHDVHLVPEDNTTELLEPAVTTDPAVQLSHATACAPLYLPAGHAVHATVDDAEYCPCRHDVHNVAPASASVSVSDPGSQASQLDACPPLYCPTSHAAQDVVPAVVHKPLPGTTAVPLKKR